MRALCIVLTWVTIVGADECSDVCTLIPGACSSKGSYCKNGHACMDLFWYRRDEILCNHEDAGCPDTNELLCSEAQQIVASRNDAGIQSLSPIRPTPARAISRVHHRPPPSSSARERNENSHFNGMTQLLRRSQRFMDAYRQDSQASFWPAVRRHIDSNDITGLVEAIESEIDENPSAFERVSYLDIFVGILHQDSSSSVRRSLNHGARIDCPCGNTRESNLSSFHRVSFRTSGQIDVSRSLQEAYRGWLYNNCRCCSCSFSATSLNEPSVILFELFETNEERVRSARIPRSVNFPFLDTTIPYRLVGIVRRVSPGDVRWGIVEDEPELDLSLFGLTGAVYERV